MGMSIRREDRQGKTIEEIPDLESLLSRFFPSWDDESYHFLRYIDPWGETVFNHLQMDELISELRRVRLKASTEEERAFVDAIEGLASRCKESDGLYLKFLGD
ncbi:MAG: hypothetical protein WB987_04565 [Candidatus Acidiferrales bacterium]